MKPQIVIGVGFGWVLSSAIAMGITAPLAGQAPAVQRGSTSDSELEVLHLRGPVWLISGAGGNITASVGRDGVLLVDSGQPQNAEKVLAAVQQIQQRVATSGAVPLGYGAETRSSLERLRVPPAPPKPIRYIINTSADPEHTGGNEKISAVGITTTGHNVARDLGESGDGAAIYAHENVLVRLSKQDGDRPEAPFGALPRFAFRSPFYKLQPYVNGEGVQLLSQAGAYTDGDVMVWFRGSDVIATGDLFSTTSYPYIDLARGGSIQGVVEALNDIVDLAFPEYIHQGGTIIIPGHGRISDSADVAYYRDMATVVRDRVQELIKKGMTLEQVKAERPTADFDPRYSTPGNPWTGDKFVEAVYRSLTASHK
jgi:glyoxylase-like metal-dependent hydrolase (beta-lactamase superfamily II)